MSTHSFCSSFRLLISQTFMNQQDGWLKCQRDGTVTSSTIASTDVMSASPSVMFPSLSVIWSRDTDSLIRLWRHPLSPPQEPHTDDAMLGSRTLRNLQKESWLTTHDDCIVVRSSIRKSRRLLLPDKSLCCTSLINKFNELGSAVVLTTTVDVFTLKPHTYYSAYQQYRPKGGSIQEGHHCDLENYWINRKGKRETSLIFLPCSKYVIRIFERPRFYNMAVSFNIS